MPIGSIVLSASPLDPDAKWYDRTFVKGQWLDRSYRHSSRAMGGFWTASFDIQDELPALEELFKIALGKQMKSYTEDGQPAWQGFINAITFDLPRASLYISLDQMANKVWGRYMTTTAGDGSGATIQNYDGEGAARQQAEAAAGGTFLKGTVYQDTAIQALFGIREAVFSAGVVTVVTPVNQAAQIMLDQYKDPRTPDISFRDGGGLGAEVFPKLTFHCKGYFHTLNWRRYNQTGSSGGANVSAIISAVNAAVGEFIDSEAVTANTTQADQVYNTDREAGSVILDLARLGDASLQKNVVGVWEDRKLIYTTGAPFTQFTAKKVNYAARVTGADSELKDGNGLVLDPALVRPDAWVRIDDLGTLGLSDLPDFTDRPEMGYIESVEYSEPSGLNMITKRANLSEMVLAKLSYQNTGSI